MKLAAHENCEKIVRDALRQFFLYFIRDSFSQSLKFGNRQVNGTLYKYSMNLEWQRINFFSDQRMNYLKSFSEKRRHDLAYFFNDTQKFSSKFCNTEVMGH